MSHLKKIILSIHTIIVPLIIYSSSQNNLNTTYQDLFKLKTPLHKATTITDVKNILKYGPDINAKDSEGFTPIDRMVERGNFEAALTLFGTGGTGNPKSIGEIFIHFKHEFRVD